jgi:hypothetical protein
VSTESSAPPPADPVPAIFFRDVAQPPVSIPYRLLSLAISLGCLGILVIASQVRPNPAGVGTHEGLGLQGCQFLERTHLPCPSCGMTTSFAWFARGNLAASFYVQPMGLVLAVLTAAMFWTSLYIALTGKPVHRLMRFLPHPARNVVFPLLAFAILAWGWKIFIHLNGMDGWK